MIIIKNSYHKEKKLIKAEILCPFCIEIKDILSYSGQGFDIYVNRKKYIPENSDVFKNGSEIVLKSGMCLYKIDLKSGMVHAETMSEDSTTGIQKLTKELHPLLLCFYKNFKNGLQYSSSTASIDGKAWAYHNIKGNTEKIINDACEKTQCIFIQGNGNQQSAIYFKPQNLIYAIPVKVFKNGELLKNSGGYYYTGNAWKVMASRNENTASLSSVGTSLNLLTAVPVCYGGYIPVYGSIQALKADKKNAGLDACLCTFADVKWTSEEYGRKGLEKKGDGIVYFGKDINIILKNNELVHVMEII